MLSIIIPTYNEEKYIGQTLADLKSKLTLPHEVIVTDDKSTDRTVEIARASGADQVLTRPVKSVSIAKNRNDGARQAKGDLFVFIDGDCRIIGPDSFFKHALERFEREPDLIAVTGKIGVWPDLETFGDRVVYPIFNFVHRVKNNWLHMGEASGKFQMMRRSAFEQIGGYREDLICREDGVMFNSLAKIGRTAYDPQLVVLHAGRRAHRIGWPKLLSIWMTETFRVAVFNRSKPGEWVDIR